MIKMGLIGLGNMGRLHLKNIVSLEQTGICKLICVCDINTDLVDKVCDQYGLCGYSCVDEMLQGESLDAVIVASTSSSHYDVTKRLIENNIPVLVEKPVVLSVRDAEELKKLTESTNTLLSPGFTEVYNSVALGAQKSLTSNENFDYIDFFRIGQKSIKNNSKDIDAVHDLMTHDISVLSMIIDLESIRDITGYLSSYNTNSNKFDTACVNLLLENSKIVRLFCDRNGTKKIRKFTVSKEDMYGEFDYMDQTAEVNTKGTLEAFGDNIWYSQHYNTTKIRYSNNPLYDELLDFILAVEQKRDTIVSPNWFDVTMTIEKIRSVLYYEMRNFK